MDNINVRQAHKEDFGTIARLIADQNKNPETHCIQSDTGSDFQSIQNETTRLASDSGICFVMAFQSDQLLGILGCELDEELGRGWLRGPFITGISNDWSQTASVLLKELLDILPENIHWLDSFLNIANKQGNGFYLDNGFRQLRLVHVYVAAPFETPLRLSNSCEVLKANRIQDFLHLHETIFPQTYATGQRILDKIDDCNQVFVYNQGSEMLGYLYAAIEEDSGDGSIEFIGVREDVRGNGIGRQLLQSALQWLFEVKKVPQATLAVNDNLTNARNLYESVGFRLKYTGVHSRKEW
jgi:ribosomal protein S18 acetylase RimI-like enzyme